MPESSFMSIILTSILLICGCLALLQAVNAFSRHSYYASRNMPLIDVVVVIMYLIVCGVVGLLFLYSGYNMIIIYGALGVGVLVALVLFIRFCFENRHTMKNGSVYNGLIN